MFVPVKVFRKKFVTTLTDNIRQQARKENVNKNKNKKISYKENKII